MGPTRTPTGKLLAEGRGVLVPCRDPQAIADAVAGLLGDDGARRAMAPRPGALGQRMEWPAVARAYLASFERASAEHAEERRASLAAHTLAARPAGLPEVNLSHLERLTDDTGGLQHAHYSVPRLSMGGGYQV